MKEHPILFSTPMVQALLEGRKTMTRRVAKVPVRDHFGRDIMDWDLSEHPYQKDGKWFYNIQTDVDDYRVVELKCPYGQLGDILWVRETWLRGCEWDGDSYPKSEMIYYYRADGIAQKIEWYDEDRDDGIRPNGPAWKPSIYMPKKACRIFLEITEVRAERLHDITEKDAEAEGAPAVECGPVYCCKCGFTNLWISINGKESWTVNPWVWVIKFKKINQP